ncbi:hypothetical protein RND81_05G267900 [Saponaria officinalis]|uniref:Strictosidine synthase conserved region domain-containing protein n=1 Tax=Saponaria officinalis TaxID=3572 RepID=A0AAW1L1Q8_SAPOF
MATSKRIVLVLMFITTVSFNVFTVYGQNRTFHKIPLGPNQQGPEALAFDCKDEGPYVGISNGRILKWNGNKYGWTEFAVTSSNRSSSCDGIFNSTMEKDCGRPLGLRFDKRSCELYIADSSFGLMKVGQNGGIASSLVNGIDGIPFMFVNGLDVDFEDEVVYFTETSSNYHRWEAAQAINNSDKSGRLMKYDAKSGYVTVLLKDLSFANGVALSKNKDFVLVAETTASRILKYWLTGNKAGTSEVFLQSSGTIDNINRNKKGDFWIAKRMAKSIKVNELGEILETLLSDEIVNPSDVQEFHHRIWVGFVDQAFIFYSS